MILSRLCIDELSHYLQGKRIICFGGGKGFETFCTVLEDINIVEYIEYIVDNDDRKWNTIKLCQHRKIGVISSSKTCELLQTGKYILIITCMYVENILGQLSEYDDLKDMPCYFYKDILASFFYKKAMTAKSPPSLKFSQEEIIPKKIHYCWFGGNSLPSQYKKWMASWIKYCPDYEIIEWNENNYDISKNKYMKQAYDAKKWGFVPDYARLDIIYEHGGIYLDTDVELIKNLDDLLYQKAFCGFQGDFKVAFGLGFGAVKNLPIIKKILDQYENINFIDNQGNLNMIASPDYQTDFLKNKGLHASGEFQTIECLNIYPVRYFCGHIGLAEQSVITEESFSIHHFDGSWVDEEKKNSIKQIKKSIYGI